MKPTILCLAALMSLACPHASAEVDWFQFTADYLPGTPDPAGRARRGTELMRLLEHEGSLFASTSMFQHDTTNGVNTGCQVLRKDSPTAEWVVDQSFGTRYLRAETLLRATFTKDINGAPVVPAATLLVVGLYDVSFTQTRHASVAVRNGPQDWTVIPVAPTSPDEPGFGSVRSMMVYEDTLTGQQYLFANCSFGAVYKLAYDTAAPGKLRVVGGNEFDGLDVGRPQSICVADGALHVAFGYGNTGNANQIGGLFRRTDGPTPSWSNKHEWYFGSPTQFEKLLRGITTVTNPATGQDNIIGGIEDPPLPVVRRIVPSPAAGAYTYVDELNYRDYFAGIFGATPNPDNMNAVAINQLEPFTLPGSTNAVHLLPTWVIHPSSPTAGFNGGYYLVRFPDGTYDWGKVADPAHLVSGVELQGVRTIVPSPWESGVYYVGGYAKDLTIESDTAWIYKASIKPAVVASRGQITVPERGSNSVNIWLSKPPAGNVTVTLTRSSGDTDIGIAGPSFLTFTPANWNVPQTVALSAAGDADTTNGSAMFSLSGPGFGSATVLAIEQDTPPPPGTLTVPIFEDTSVWQSNPASNYGTNQTLRVAGGGAGNDWNALLKFNVSGVYGTVTNAKLRLYNLDVLAGTVSVFKTANNNWSETTATWNNAPAAQQQLGQWVNPAAGQYVEWDVTSAITTDGVVSFRLTHTNPGQSQDFRSREFGVTPPQLVITFDTAPPTQVTNFAFTRDYTPGTLDTNGQLRSGIELMRLTSYQGKLYAATSMFGDTYGTAPYSGYTGCQVLRKDSSSAAWQVDVSFGSKYLRTDCLEVIRFTHDEFGNALAAPVEMLVAGIWDLGAPPAGTGRFNSVAIRNDTTGQWLISNVAPVPDNDAGFASVRSMMVHRDTVTGTQYLFVGGANGGIFKGVYDATVPGRIRWVGSNEVDSTYGRPQSVTEANGSLYVSFDYGGVLVTGQTGGVYRRSDGATPSWQQVYRNYDASQPNQNQTFRGLTAVPGVSGPGDAVLGGIEYIPAPLITRIEPGAGDAALTELNYWDHFTAVFGTAPLIDNNVGAAALNKCEPFPDPQTGTTQHFITTNLRHPNDPQTGYNGAYFLLRRSATHYEWCEVPSLGLPTGQQLRGIRTVEKSPFADEPRTYYFGGYGAGLTKVSNTAWIYKGVYRTPFEMQMAALSGSPAQKSFTADLDGDGLANGIEFAFGLNANNPNDGTGVPQPTFNFATGTTTMSVTTPPGLWGLRYGAQYSENLTSWTNLTDTGTGSTHLFTLPLLNRPRLFLRWVITSD